MSEGTSVPAERPGGSGQSGTPGGSGVRGAVRGFLPIFIICSLVITPAALIGALVLTGNAEEGPHFGSAMSLFPFSFLGAMLLPSFPRWPWFAIAFAQYPLYALVFDILLWKGKLKWGLLVIGALHLIAAAICLSGALQMPVGP